MKQKILEEFKLWLLTQPNYNINSEKKAGAYIRVSTNRQEELSPMSQLKEIYRWSIKNNYYLDLNYIFIEEEGISGKSINKRTDFQNMIAVAKIKPKPFDCLAIWKFSRFARNQEESIVYKSMLRKQCSIDVISVSEPLIEGPFGTLIERIIEWMDEYYLINLGGEVTRGMTEKVNKGGIVSVAAYGYKIIDGKYIIDENESKIVKLIFHKFVNDNWTMSQISKYLNDIGIKTKRENNFENRTIFYILLNPVYIGKIRWTPDGKLTREDMFDNTKSIVSDGIHDAIIDEALFYQAYDKLKLNRKFSVPHKKVSSDPWHWLKGLIRCNDCNKTYVRTNDKLRCNGYNKASCDVRTSLNIDEVEQLVLSQLKLIYTAKIDIKLAKSNISKKDSKKDELSIIKEKIKFTEEKFNRIKNAFECGIDTIQEYEDNKKRILMEKDNLLSKLENISNNPNDNNNNVKIKINENCKTVYEILTNPKISMKEKYDVTHFLINRIMYNDDNNHLTLYFNEI